MKNKESEKIEQKLAFEREMNRRIAILEKTGHYDIDPADDPPTIPLELNNVDYLNEKLSSKINTKIANFVAFNFINHLIKTKKLIIKDIIGMENLNSVNSGFFITCNHFNPFDNFAIEKVYEKSIHYKKKKLYKVIREGNYTNFKGLYGYFFRHCDTLPLAKSQAVFKKFNSSLDTILQRGDIVLIYPEQSLWLNYQKPKPLKAGVFKFAIRNNVPIVPCFITFEDSDVLDEGTYVKEYTIHISEPIYPDNSLSKMENVENMMAKHSELWKEIYERVYQKKLTYPPVEENENYKDW